MPGTMESRKILGSKMRKKCPAHRLIIEGNLCLCSGKYINSYLKNKKASIKCIGLCMADISRRSDPCKSLRG